MQIDFLKEVFHQHADDDAFIWRGSSYSYAWLLDQLALVRPNLVEEGIEKSSVVLFHGDYTPHAIAVLLSLIERGAVVIPVAPTSSEHSAEYMEISQAEFELRLGEEGRILATRTGNDASHELLLNLKERAQPGLVLFSSGSTGEAKGVVHDLSRLLTKYQTRRHCYRTLAFLLFDHIGGLDTLFYSLSNGSCLVLCEDRSPDAICKLVEECSVRVLPVAPSFLKLLAISGVYERYDLSSVSIVTYGAELMPASTLERCAEMFPGAKLMQKFGTSEVGTLRSKSRSSDSLWVKLGGEGYETRIVDDELQIKAESSMLGYLNDESPFTDDGWFKTGDCVDVDGEYIRFRGRSSDLINVGGRKVHPAEVESVIGALDNIAEVAVMGEANALMGQVVCARVVTVKDEDAKALNRRVRLACKKELESHKVPSKIEIVEGPLTTERFKVRRK